MPAHLSLERLFPHLLLPSAPSLSTGKIGSNRPFFPGVLAFMPCEKAPFLCSCSCCLCSPLVYLLALPVFFLLLAGCRASQNLVLKCEVTSGPCGSGPSLHSQWLRNVLIHCFLTWVKAYCNKRFSMRGATSETDKMM